MSNKYEVEYRRYYDLKEMILKKAHWLLINTSLKDDLEKKREVEALITQLQAQPMQYVTGTDEETIITELNLLHTQQEILEDILQTMKDLEQTYGKTH